MSRAAYSAFRSSARAAGGRREATGEAPGWSQLVLFDFGTGFCIQRPAGAQRRGRCACALRARRAAVTAARSTGLEHRTRRAPALDLLLGIAVRARCGWEIARPETRSSIGVGSSVADWVTGWPSVGWPPAVAAEGSPAGTGSLGIDVVNFRPLAVRHA